MQYTLKPYQETAVAELTEQLRRAGEDFRATRTKPKPRRTAASLAAVTGAGKTVMAAATIERVVAGDLEGEGDPTAVFLWFSDSPELNRQSQRRLHEAWGADTAVTTRRIDTDTFREDVLQPGTVYFINSQKLGKNSTLVRGHGEQSAHLRVPDAGDYDFWRTVKNTVENPDITLYLVIDEAHRGMKKTKDAAKTIVQRLIAGEGDVPAVPVVLGISATPDRFRATMAQAREFSTEPEVTVDAAQVQDSGLLKDVIELVIPDEEGTGGDLFDHTLLKTAVVRWRESTRAWREYVARTNADAVETHGNDADLVEVTPLLIVQVPNQASPKLIGQYLTTIFAEEPTLTVDDVALVYGDADVTTDHGTIRHVAANTVAADTDIKVLLAKESITTGWDCPRAEVMVSFRAAQDKTYITQLLGRMIRTPLARRVAGNDVLNSAVCILPRFDRDVAESVARTVSGGGTDWSDEKDTTGGETLRRVLINPEEVTPVTGGRFDDAWAAFEALPSMVVPHGGSSKPIRRVEELAALLVTTGVDTNAAADVTEKLVRSLEAAQHEYRDELDEAKHDVTTVTTRSVVSRGEGLDSTKVTEVAADDRAIDGEVRAARRRLSTSIERAYTKQHAAATGRHSDTVAALKAARVAFAASGKIDEIVENVEGRATKLFGELADEYRVAIKGAGDEALARYTEIVTSSPSPQRVPLVVPQSRMVPTRTSQQDQAGNTVSSAPLDRYAHHMLQSAGDELFPASLNTWEKEVVYAESARDGFVGWLRNTGSADSTVGGAYTDVHGKYRRVVPDFLFFHEVAGEVKVSIVDPHTTTLSDATEKVQGMAEFVADNPGAFHRVEVLSKVAGHDGFRVLDLTDEKVRAAVMDAVDARELYADDAVTRNYV